MGPHSLRATEGLFAPGRQLDAASVRSASDAELGSLARVEIRGPITVETVERLDADAARLRALAFTGWPPSTVSREVVHALVATRRLPLEVLDLSGTEPDDDVVVQLAGGRVWPALRVLIAPGVGDAAVTALAASGAFPALRGLSLTSGGLTEVSARALASPTLPWTLERLEVGWNPFSQPAPGTFDPRQMGGGRARSSPLLRSLLARHRVVCLVDDHPTHAEDLA